MTVEDEGQIREFCTLTYGVQFPMFEKVQVTGAQATPLYQRLQQATGEAPGWNFHKYLVDREGRVVASFDSRTRPDDPELVARIEALLVVQDRLQQLEHYRHEHPLHLGLGLYQGDAIEAKLRADLESLERTAGKIALVGTNPVAAAGAVFGLGGVGLDDLGVVDVEELAADLRRPRADAADDLRQRVDLLEELPRGDPLGRVGDEHVRADVEPAVLGEVAGDEVGGVRRDRRAQDERVARPQVREQVVDVAPRSPVEIFLGGEGPGEITADFITAPSEARCPVTRGNQMSSQIGSPIRTSRKVTGSGSGPGVNTRFSSKTP